MIRSPDESPISNKYNVTEPNDDNDCFFDNDDTPI